MSALWKVICCKARVSSYKEHSETYQAGTEMQESCLAEFFLLDFVELGLHDSLPLELVMYCNANSELLYTYIFKWHMSEYRQLSFLKIVVQCFLQYTVDLYIPPTPAQGRAYLDRSHLP